jgi:uncharacterized phage protein (TIGR02218 family)
VSKTMAAAATTHLAQRVTTMAMCWKITRVDGLVLAFTDFHSDLVISGVTYESQSGMVRATAISGGSDLSVQNADMETVLDSDAIDREDLESGLFDYAEVKIFLVNYLDPDAFQIKLLRGRLGEVSLEQQTARAELRSLTQMLQQRTGRTHEVACSYELGDAKCGVDLDDFRVTGTVTAVVNQHRIADTSRTQAADWFNQGKITFTSGNCAGLSMEIQRWTGGGTKNFVLSLDMPYPIEVGDEYTASPGCNKTYATCKDKFDNMNFSGFPHIPGTDFALSFPSVPNP